MCSAIVLFAFLIRGLTGFGSGLLMVPMFLLFLDIKLVVPVANLLSLLSGIFLLLTFQTRKWIRKDVLLPMIIGVVIGVALGTYVLRSYRSDLLKQLFGIFISAYAIKMLFWNDDNGKELKNYVGLIAGFLGGCLGGMFASGGPPAIIYLKRKAKDKQVFRATLTFYFLVSNMWQTATFSYARLINMESLKLALYLVPAFITGNLIGSFMHVRINQRLFDRIVALVLLITGIFLII